MFTTIFRKWSRDGTIEEIHEVLRKRLRNKQGREESPSIRVIDSQSVKVTKISGECRDIDRGKKIKGRKQHIVTDTQGLLIGLKVHAANEHDSRSGFRVSEYPIGRFERLKTIYADGGYRGELIEKEPFNNQIKQIVGHTLIENDEPYMNDNVILLDNMKVYLLKDDEIGAY